MIKQHKDKKASLSLLENCPVRNYIPASKMFRQDIDELSVTKVLSFCFVF